MKVTDLSHIINTNMSTYTKDERLEVYDIASIEKDGYNEKLLRLCTHTGTHIDAPSHMINKGKGNIINISSIWGDTGASCEVLYSSTKGAINLFTKSLAKELAPMGIRVNAIAPGVIDTEMNSFLSKEEREELEEEIPLGRFGNPVEVAKMITFLCSDKCEYLTGQIIKIDGAML